VPVLYLGDKGIGTIWLDRMNHMKICRTRKLSPLDRSVMISKW